MSKQTIVIGVVSYDGSWSRSFRRGLDRVTRHLGERGYKVIHTESIGSKLPCNREDCGDVTVAEKGDYLLFIDCDTECVDTSVVDRLLLHNVDIVNAVSVGKQPPFTPHAAMWDEARRLWLPLKVVPKHALCQVDAVGCGFMLIKRRVLEGTPKAWFLCVDRGGYGRCDTMEDFYFCWKAGEAGFKVYLDTCLGICHVGSYGFTLRDYWALEELRLQRQREIAAVGKEVASGSSGIH